MLNSSRRLAVATSIALAVSSLGGVALASEVTDATQPAALEAQAEETTAENTAPEVTTEEAATESKTDESAAEKAATEKTEEKADESATSYAIDDVELIAQNKAIEGGEEAADRVAKVILKDGEATAADMIDKKGDPFTYIWGADYPYAVIDPSTDDMSVWKIREYQGTDGKTYASLTNDDPAINAGYNGYYYDESGRLVKVPFYIPMELVDDLAKQGLLTEYTDTGRQGWRYFHFANSDYMYDASAELNALVQMQGVVPHSNTSSATEGTVEAPRQEAATAVSYVSPTTQVAVDAAVAADTTAADTTAVAEKATPETGDPTSLAGAATAAVAALGALGSAKALRRK